VQLVSQDSQDAHHQSASPQRPLPASHAHLDLQDHQAHRDHQANLDPTDQLARTVCQERTVSLAHLDLQDPTASPAPMEPQENPASLAPTNPLFPENPVQLVSLVPLVRRDPLDPQAQMELQASQEPKVRPVHPDLPAKMENLAKTDHLGPRDLRERRASVRSTAPSTVASSSRTEPGDKRQLCQLPISTILSCSSPVIVNLFIAYYLLVYTVS
jgi:hypothetical protein